MGLLENKKLENNNIVIMNFTGAYEKQEFYGDLGAVWLDLRDIQGTNCYCDEEAEAAIKERIRPMGPSGIHFLDSGNYHYVSKIWLDKVEGEFELLVFDHHTDCLLYTSQGSGGFISDILTAQIGDIPYIFHLDTVHTSLIFQKIDAPKQCGFS